jgi:hypothetical protein
LGMSMERWGRRKSLKVTGKCSKTPEKAKKQYRNVLAWGLKPKTAVFGALEAKEGKDGRTVIYPKSWATNEGKDGRLVAYPKGWKAVEGNDGRKVAHPLGGKPLMGKDGRKVVVPNGELLFPWADTVALLYAEKKDIALKEWYNLVLYRFINSDDKSLQKGVAGNQDALVKKLRGAKIYSQEKPPKYLG